MDDKDNTLWNMYGGGAKAKPAPTPVATPDKFKMASRVIGGLKAQNAHTKTVEIDGEFHTFPKAEYVAQMETQLREARNEIRELKNKMQRTARNQERILNKLRQLEIALDGKLDSR